MTELQDFIRRNAFGFAALAAGLVAYTVAGPAHRPNGNVVWDTQAGSQLLAAADTRAERQFQDFKKVLKVVHEVLPLQMNGANRDRVLAKAERDIAAGQPDGGAAAYDGVLFKLAAVLPSSREFQSMMVDVNAKKLDLQRAALDLTDIKTAILTENSGRLAIAIEGLDEVLSRHPDMAAAAAADGRYSGDPMAVKLEAVRQVAEQLPQRIDVTVDPKRIDVTIPR